MRILMLFAASLLLFAPKACSHSREWQPTVLIKAPYGSDEGEFFYDEAAEQEDPTNMPVSCFYVCPKGIFIVDEIQHNLKIYDLSGNYQRIILLRIEDKNRGFITPWPFVDMAVNGDRIYLLYSMAGIPYQGTTKNSIYVYGISSGVFEEQIMIHNETIGLDSNGHEVTNTLHLVNESEGTVSVFDSNQQRSYIIIQEQKPVAPEKHNAWLPGRKFGTHRITYEKETNSAVMIEMNGSAMRRLFEGYPAAISDQDHFTLSSRPTDSGSKTCRIIRKFDNELGIIELDSGSRSSWTAFQPRSRWRFGPDGKIYEVFVDNDAVYVLKWSD